MGFSISPESNLLLNTDDSANTDSHKNFMQLLESDQLIYYSLAVQ